MCKSSSVLRIDVSVGEAIDKLNILELKLVKIHDSNKRADIQAEIQLLNECVSPIKESYHFLYKMLTHVNEQIWDMTDFIKKMSYTDSSFAYTSHQIFEWNQKRFRLKSFFNDLMHSTLKEHKSYSSNVRTVHIDSVDTIYRKIAEINYLSIEYDHIQVDMKYKPVIQRLFKQPNILCICPEAENKVEASTLDLQTVVIPESDHRMIYELPTLNYVCGGFLGDFIHSLSVIKEMFMETGRKGRLFMSIHCGGDSFKYGLENTYKDIFEMVSRQSYIHEFALHTDEPIDINLNKWRASPLLYNGNFHGIYKDTYNIDFGKHAWLDVPVDEVWKDTVFINISQSRFPLQIDYTRIYDMYKESLVFISNVVSDYDYFTKQTNVDIRHYNPTDFTSLCVAIHSCKLFIGNLSCPLTIAHACEKERYMCLRENESDNAHVMGLQDTFTHIHVIDELYTKSTGR